MARTELAAIVGSITGMLTVLSFAPQAIHAWRTQRTKDLSRGTFILLTIQAVGWTSYGVLLRQQPIIWTNVCVLLLALVILAAKVRYG
jgi:uncharacterized protein with PQ loop repeat